MLRYKINSSKNVDNTTIQASNTINDYGYISTTKTSHVWHIESKMDTYKTIHKKKNVWVLPKIH